MFERERERCIYGRISRISRPGPAVDHARYRPCRGAALCSMRQRRGAASPAWLLAASERAGGSRGDSLPSAGARC